MCRWMLFKELRVVHLNLFTGWVQWLCFTDYAVFFTACANNIFTFVQSSFEFRFVFVNLSVWALIVTNKVTCRIVNRYINSVNIEFQLNLVGSWPYNYITFPCLLHSSAMDQSVSSVWQKHTVGMWCLLSTSMSCNYCTFLVLEYCAAACLIQVVQGVLFMVTWYVIILFSLSMAWLLNSASNLRTKMQIWGVAYVDLLAL